MYRRRVGAYPVRRAKLPPGYRREKRLAARGLYPALDDIIKTLKQGIADVAKTFGRTEAWVRAQIFGGSKNARFIRAVRKTRLYDAYVHFKSKELNKDLAPGEKWQLPDIKEKIRRERINYKQRPVEEHQQWIKEYEEHKEATQREKRVNRKAEELDASSALKRVSTDLDTLHTRTGVRCVLIASRSDILVTMNPYIFSTQAAEDFFILTFGKTLDQVARAFEIYNIHGISGLITPPKNAAELKHELRTMLQNKLTEILQKRYEDSNVPAPTLVMNYVSYDSVIVQAHRVRLIGWTFNGGTLINPGQLPMHEMRALYEGLVAKTVYWEVIPATESLPAVDPQERRERSDKGEVRGPNKRTRDKVAAAAKADSRPKKKRRKNQPPSEESEPSGSENEE